MFLSAAEGRRGDTGDIWTPVTAEANGTKALTVSQSGLTYRLLQEILFTEDWERRPALRVRTEDGAAPVIVAQVLPRGQGKTKGYHERRIPLTPESRGWLRDPGVLARLAAFAEDRVKQVGEVQRRILHPALCQLLQGAPEDLDLRDDRTRRWLDHLDHAVDAEFFDRLWHDFPRYREDPEAAMAIWEERLYHLARAELDDAFHSAAVPEARDFRAVAIAENTFEGSARNNLKQHFAARAGESVNIEEGDDERVDA